MNPPVSSWISRSTPRCWIRSDADSPDPYMIVAVDGMPILWASTMIRADSAVRIFPGQMRLRTLSTRISAAVPAE